MQINKIVAKNFLSIGEPIEIDFRQYGNIVVIKGNNKDQGPGASNGSGKSTLTEVIVYALFGELIKNLNHKEAINVKAKSNLEVQIDFNIDGHDYKVIRRRQPNELELWKDDVDESKGGIPATQEEINKIIKLNFTSFINIVCFGQHNTKQFLASNPATKRSIAENLLSLEKYNKFSKITKEKLKELQTKIDHSSVIYDKSIQDISRNEVQLKQIARQREEWKSAKLNSIENLKSQISKIKIELSMVVDSKSADNYNQLQIIEKELNEKLLEKAKLSENLNDAMEKINELKMKHQNAMMTIKEVQYEINNKNKEINDIEKHNSGLLSKDGTKCPACYGVVDKSNFESILSYNNKHRAEISEELEKLLFDIKNHQDNYKKAEVFIEKIQGVCNDKKINELSLGRDIKNLEQKKHVINVALRQNASSAMLLLEQQKENLEDQIDHNNRELASGDPYGEITTNIKTELEKTLIKSNELKVEIQDLEQQRPYYEFWTRAFGDSGIRSFVISEIIPILNSRINYWLQFLVDNKIKLIFDNELEERIERNPVDGDPFVYNAMSGGEHQRIDFAIALAFSQVMMLTANTSPSLICLDEIGTNLDRPGIQAVYNTICELSRERQVLVITHDPDLLEMLATNETINVVKENGYTRIEK